jgi:hypothetical protein
MHAVRGEGSLSLVATKTRPNARSYIAALKKHVSDYGDEQAREKHQFE